MARGENPVGGSRDLCTSRFCSVISLSFQISHTKFLRMVQCNGLTDSFYGLSFQRCWFCRLLLRVFAGERGYTEIPLFVSGVGSATGALYAALTAADVAGGEVLVASYKLFGSR